MDTSDTSPNSPPTLSFEYDPTVDERIALAAVRAVAIASDRDPIDLPPIGEVIDPEALQTSVESSIDDGSMSLAISFVYEGYLVRIDGDGTVAIFEHDG